MRARRFFAAQLFHRCVADLLTDVALKMQTAKWYAIVIRESYLFAHRLINGITLTLTRTIVFHDAVNNSP